MKKGTAEEAATTKILLWISIIWYVLIKKNCMPIIPMLLCSGSFFLAVSNEKKRRKLLKLSLTQHQANEFRLHSQRESFWLNQNERKEIAQ